MKPGSLALAVAVCLAQAACVSDGRSDLSTADLAAARLPQARNCATLAKEVNRYVRLGRSAALKELRTRAAESEKSIEGEKAEFSQLCLILFSEGDRALRAPGFGLLMGVPVDDLKSRPDDWPIFPMVRSGGTYFALGQRYFLTGQPELAVDYLSYCAKHGKFRSRPVKVPTRAEALRDLEALRQSPRWQAIRWKYGIKGQGSYFDGHELFVLDDLLGQLPPE